MWDGVVRGRHVYRSRQVHEREQDRQHGLLWCGSCSRYSTITMQDLAIEQDRHHRAVHLSVVRATHLYLSTYMYERKQDRHRRAVDSIVLSTRSCCIVLLCHIGGVSPGLPSCCIIHVGTLRPAPTLPM